MATRRGLGGGTRVLTATRRRKQTGSTRARKRAMCRRLMLREMTLASRRPSRAATSSQVVRLSDVDTGGDASPCRPQNSFARQRLFAWGLSGVPPMRLAAAGVVAGPPRLVVLGGGSGGLASWRLRVGFAAEAERAACLRAVIRLLGEIPVRPHSNL